LRAFLAAATIGDLASLKSFLAEDVVLAADTGPAGGQFGRVRNLPGPLVGREKVAAFVAAAGPQGAEGLTIEERMLNGQPAIVVSRDGRAFAAIMIDVACGLIHGVFMQAETERLQRVGS
jgi:RNA polymerase sigma-70 factor (ECF subfamily)